MVGTYLSAEVVAPFDGFGADVVGESSIDAGETEMCCGAFSHLSQSTVCRTVLPMSDGRVQQWQRGDSEQK